MRKPDIKQFIDTELIQKLNAKEVYNNNNNNKRYRLKVFHILKNHP